jgi:tetratricopeptide (TPR) repeat protein
VEAPSEYLVRRGLQLALAGNEDEAIAVLRQAVAIAPEASTAWLNLGMLLNRRSSAEACWAFTEFLRTTCEGDPFISFAAGILRGAGCEVPTPRPAIDSGLEADADGVILVVNAGGKRILITADNDSGIQPDDLLATLHKMMDAPTWLDAYLFYVSHPELLSSLARIYLEVYAGQNDDRQAWARSS